AVHRAVRLPLLVLLDGPARFALYALALRDALPIFNPGVFNGANIGAQPFKSSFEDILNRRPELSQPGTPMDPVPRPTPVQSVLPDRKSTRLNSSHVKISYAVFCLKKERESRLRQVR